MKLLEIRNQWSCHVEVLNLRFFLFVRFFLLLLFFLRSRQVVWELRSKAQQLVRHVELTPIPTNRTNLLLSRRNEMLLHHGLELIQFWRFKITECIHTTRISTIQSKLEKRTCFSSITNFWICYRLYLALCHTHNKLRSIWAWIECDITLTNADFTWNWYLYHIWYVSCNVLKSHFWNAWSVTSSLSFVIQKKYTPNVEIIICFLAVKRKS